MGKVNSISEMYYSRKPRTRDHYVGIEIECIVPNENVNALILALSQLPIADQITVHEDSSIQPGSDMLTGKEFCLLAKQSQLKSSVNMLCRVLSKFGAYTNSSCGLHVHLDMRYRNPNKAYNNLVRIEDVLFSMYPDRIDNSFCRKQEHRTLYEAIDDLLDGIRYRSINVEALRDHSTLEVRVAAGSVDANVICNWAKVLIRAVESKFLTYNVRTAAQLIAALNLDTPIAKYVKKAIA